jgi:hypothetical protein
VLGGAAGWFVKSRRSAGGPSSSDSAWPPLRLVDPVPPEPAGAPGDGAAAQADDRPTAPDGAGDTLGGEHAFAGTGGASDDAAVPGWVPPVDGACPISHPVKANDQSGIYHLPGGRSYDRTIAERCYSTGEAAEADGYRRSKA